METDLDFFGNREPLVPLPPNSDFFKSDAEKRLLEWLGGARLHHAVILSGLTPERRRQMAVEMAKVLFCQSPLATGAGCQKCSACLRLQQGGHPDLVIFDSKATDYIRIEQIRQFCGELDIGQTESHFKIGVLDNADRMNPAAANAFLKTLEEPREGRLLWLLASQPNAMLPTIRSRCLEMSLGASTFEVKDKAEDQAMADAFLEWTTQRKIPSLFSEVEKDREKGLKWAWFFQSQLRNAVVVEPSKIELADKNRGFFKQWSPYELMVKFEKAVELEGRLRSQANYALMLEVFLRSELSGVSA